MYLAQRVDVEYREKRHEKIQRKVRYLFWDRAQTEERRKGKSSLKERPRKDGDLQLTQQESQMKEQAVKIESICQEESSWQWTATWEQLWERKKVQLFRSQVTKEESPKHVYFWHSEGWTPRNEAALEAVVKQASTTRHPWLVACDANMCPEDFEKSLWFQRENGCM